jgi:hypothetical protein
VDRRNEDRKNKAAASRQLEKAGGYIPRSKRDPKFTGLTVTGKENTKTQEMDAESAAGLKKVLDNDAEIDAGLDSVDKALENLGNISLAMKDEVNTFPLAKFLCFTFFSDFCRQQFRMLKSTLLIRIWRIQGKSKRLLMHVNGICLDDDFFLVIVVFYLIILKISVSFSL